MAIKRTGSATPAAISPARLSLLIGQSRPLTIVNAAGDLVLASNVSSSDSGVATVSTGAFGTVVTGVGAGEATISVGNSELATTVQVYAGDALPSGAVIWSLPAFVNGFAYRQHDGTGPQLFAAAFQLDGGMVIQGMGPGGELLSSTSLPPGVTFAPFGDVFGGLTGVSTQTLPDTSTVTSIRKLADPSSDSPPWDYTSDLQMLTGPVVQGPDGTTYLLEYEAASERFTTSFVSALDGATGDLLYRTALPQSRSCGNDFTKSIDRYAGTPTWLVVGADGAAYVGVTTYDDSCTIGNSLLYKSNLARTGYLVRATAQSVGVQTVRSSSAQIRCQSAACVGEIPPSVDITQLTPDQQGGLLVSGFDTPYQGTATPWLARRLFSGGVDMLTPEQPDASRLTVPTVASTSGAVFGWNDSGFRTFDPTTGQPTGSALPVAETEQVVDVLPNDGILVRDLTAGTITQISSDGERGDSESVPASYFSSHVSESSIDGYDEDGLFTRFAIASAPSRTFYNPATGGNLQAQGGPEKPHFVMYAPVANYDGRPTPYYANDAKIDFLRAIDATRVTPSAKMVQEANLISHPTALPVGTSQSGLTMSWGFLDDLSSRNANVVGFLGHAIEPDVTPPVSVGLSFFDRDLVKKRTDNLVYTNWRRAYIPPANPNPTAQEILQAIAAASQRALPWSYPIDHVPNQAQIVFIGSCFIGPEFLSLWNASLNPDRALIVPQGQTTADLVAAAQFAWPAFVAALSNGKSLTQAVAAANTACGSRCGAPITWQKYGGENVKNIVPPK